MAQEGLRQQAIRAEKDAETIPLNANQHCAGVPALTKFRSKFFVTPVRSFGFFEKKLYFCSDIAAVGGRFVFAVSILVW